MGGGPASGRGAIIPVQTPAAKSPWLLTLLEFSQLPLIRAIAAGNYKETMLLLARDAEVPVPYEDIRRWLNDIGRLKDLPIFIVQAVHPNEIGHLSRQEYEILEVSSPRYLKKQQRRWTHDITPDSVVLKPPVVRLGLHWDIVQG